MADPFYVDRDYAKGDLVTNSGYLYSALVDMEAGEWDETKWLRTNVTAQMPTRTSQLVNDSGFLLSDSVLDWRSLEVTQLDSDIGRPSISYNPILRMFRAQIVYKSSKGFNAGGWYDMATFDSTPFKGSSTSVQCSMDIENDHTRYLLGRVVLSTGKFQFYAYDGRVNSGLYINVVGSPVLIDRY